MTAKDPLSRSQHIEQSIANDNLDAATKQLLDFEKEFSTQRSTISEVIIIRQQYKQFSEDKRLGIVDNETYNLNIRRLIKQILDCKDHIIDEYNQLNLDNSSSFPNTSTIPNSQTNTTHQSPSSSQTRYEIAREIFFNQQKQQDKESIKTAVQGINIAKVYKSRSIKFCLSPIDIELNLGEITAVVGENGNGKTTLLRMIAGDLAISEGKLNYPLLMGSRKKDWYLIKQQIAYLPQELPKWYGLLMNNLHFTANIHGIKGKDNVNEVNWIIYRLGLEAYRKAKWSEISSGYKTRFSLARALVWKPKLLIFDEPLANLDINAQGILLQDLRDIVNSQKYPLTAVISSQHLYEVESIADKIIFLKDGEAKYNGLVSDFGKYRECNLFEINCAVDEEELISILESIGCSRIEKQGITLLFILRFQLAVLKFYKFWQLIRFLSSILEILVSQLVSYLKFKLWHLNLFKKYSILIFFNE